MQGVEGVEGDQDDFVFDDVLPDILPRLPVKFKGKDWTSDMARKCLQRYMNALGFYRGSKNNYKRSSDKPGWPDSVSLETIEHASYVKLENINTIIQSLLESRNIDPHVWYIGATLIGEESDETDQPVDMEAAMQSMTLFLLEV